MKKILCNFLAIEIAVLLIIFCPLYSKSVKAEKREINVYSVEDYIGEDVIENFNDSHDFDVNYYTMATVEELYNELKKNPNGANLLCPSEYMVMKMIEEDMIKPFTMPENFKNGASEYINKKFSELGFYEDDDKTYAVGYMWGTMGFVYNMDVYSAEDDDWNLNAWNAVLDNKYFDRITIKDSIRDTYTMSVGAIYRDELLALNKNSENYNASVTEIFNRTDDETIAKVQEFLQDAKQNLYCFEVDSAKSDIIRERIDVYFAWSGDAVYALESGAEVGVNLGYVIPDEGSNVWFDAYVMSKSTTGQQEADCIEFLNYLCSDDVVVENMDYTGYTSCIATDTVFELAQDWYSAEMEMEYYSADEKQQLIDDEEYFEEDFVCVDTENDLYSVIGVYGEVEEDGEGGYRLRGVEVTEDGDVVDSLVPVYALDLNYFFGGEDYVIYSTEDNFQMLYAQYPDEETINRCAIMANFDTDTLTKINEMWSKVKLTTLSTTAIWLIIGCIILVIVILVLFKFNDKIYIEKKKKNNNKQRRKDLTVIKIEEL